MLLGNEIEVKLKFIKPIYKVSVRLYIYDQSDNKSITGNLISPKNSS